jgi:hypothetical protein
MPDGTRPAEEGAPEEVGGESGVDAQEVLRTFAAAADEAVVHPEPIPIPSGAIPSPPAPAPRSSIGPTLVIGACGSLWFAAALSSGATIPIVIASFWFAFLAVDLWIVLRS